jgi:hypothetical protein
VTETTQTNRPQGQEESQMTIKSVYIRESIKDVLTKFPKGTPAREAGDAMPDPPPAKEPQPGDRMSIKGYDVMATAAVDDGTVLVVSNNSSHFLVVWQGEEHVTDQGMLMASYPYGAYTKRAYLAALSTMADRAVRMSSSLDEWGL